ncbi:MAG: hypothetical protein AB8I56_16345 [Anaerolineales bacterium]
MKANHGITKSCQWFRWIVLVTLTIVAAACSRPQQTSSIGKGVPGANNGPAGPNTITPSVNPGEAIFNYERNVSHTDPNGSDIQHEVATVPLVFSTSAEGPLIVKGSGNIVWSDVADYPKCGYKATAEGTVQMTGLFYFDTCTFSLTMTYKYSQPYTYDQSPDCTNPLHFDQTEFSTPIKLDSSHSYFNEVKQMNYWDLTTANITDLKSSPIENCFPVQEINRSTPTP